MRVIELAGQVFGHWTVLGRAPGVTGKTRWRCACSCGRIKHIRGQHLRSGASASCGCASRTGAIASQDYTGRRFSHLVSLGRVDRVDRNGSRVFESVRCDCGTVKEVSIYSLVDGGTKSCGCLKSQLISRSKLVHGHGNGSSTYRSWAAARERCCNPANKRWHRYGGRGIKMCERWSVFDNFLADMGPKPGPGYEIDRIDNDGDYEPSNCRWSSRRDNMNNTSAVRPVTAFGKTMTVAQWSRASGINPETIRGRLSRGWSAERSVSVEATMANDLALVRQILLAADDSSVEGLKKAICEVQTLIAERLADTPLGQWSVSQATASEKPN